MSAQKISCIIVINFSVTAGKHKVGVTAVPCRLKAPRGAACADRLPVTERPRAPSCHLR